MRISLLAAALCLCAAPVLSAPLAIAIHGGAGTIDPNKMSPETEAQVRAKLKEAVRTGYAVLQEGGSSLDAVQQAVQVLESSPLFNAGVGAVYTYEGAHELDASIMDGRTLEAGAVAGVRQVKSPIELARRVMTDSPHVMLSGQGAVEFALDQGLELVPNHYFDTDSRYQSLLRAKKKIMENQQHTKDYKAAVDSLDPGYKYGTVGAVALDSDGNLAAATSTGGMTAKRWGRIGDSPVIGAGTYADNGSCAVSATGHGEYFIRYNVAADICARVKYQGVSINKAASEVIHRVLKPVGGTGGVIVVSPKGEIVMPYNTGGMYRASIDKAGQVSVKIWEN
ncbi:isoaspartyl peptidase/L-asparaginase [Ferrimonas sp. YFM]|uniref:isoaspartyl peptidase/L-asparaginase family protein n=1 Tax=Ferrimonas sp. YFM TaxID=3028878 RepID=UPI0025730704|nr:isoaspartyl peptidase/L-asparaginase [Ferrimonas sp. YFM]BDY05638.1 isoaspartyl peptidase/L-asparaginase [Ferrimonas sp. YFM]